jgi:hypothetical protein
MRHVAGVVDEEPTQILKRHNLIFDALQRSDLPEAGAARGRSGDSQRHNLGLFNKVGTSKKTERAG